MNRSVLNLGARAGTLWCGSTLTALAAVAIAFNVCGVCLWVLGTRNTLGVYAGMAMLTIPDADVGMDRSKSDRFRVEWQEPVWRTHSWVWAPTVVRGQGPVNRVTPVGAPLTPLVAPGFTVLHIPLWLIFVPSAMVAIPLWRSDLRRRKWRRLGACESCGYPSPTDGRNCPECGRASGPR